MNQAAGKVVAISVSTKKGIPKTNVRGGKFHRFETVQLCQTLSAAVKARIEVTGA